MLLLPGNDPAAIQAAAQRLADGELLGLPTETVYGLAARADRDEAVAKIFAAKGRPSDHPLIVHVLDAAGAEPEALDRQLAVDPRDDRLAVLGHVRAPDRHQVAVEDAVVAHLIALDPQQVIRALPEQRAVEREHLVGFGRRADRRTRRHPAEDRQLQPAGRAMRSTCLAQADAARAIGHQLQAALGGERFEVLDHPARAGEAVGGLDFRNAGRHAFALAEAFDEGQDAGLPFGECVHGINIYTFRDPLQPGPWCERMSHGPRRRAFDESAMLPLLPPGIPGATIGTAGAG